MRSLRHLRRYFFSALLALGTLFALPIANAACSATWSASAVYTGGMTASLSGIEYRANWWTQGDNPATHNGGPGSGQPWTSLGNCSAQPPPPPPPGSLLFSLYKDITISMNWNTNVISTAVTGTIQGLLTVMPTNLRAVTWAFATGECGSENWGGLQANAVVAANVQSFVSMGKSYIISTGGAAGSFTCGSDAGFETFIQRYNSSRLAGIDFDIESGQSQQAIANLVQRVKVARVNHPNLRFSFTIATLGGNAAQSLGQTGVNVINAIKAGGCRAISST
ncbi:MAG: carbohydrate-binding protein [Steroidobacteraceae bacterium]